MYSTPLKAVFTVIICSISVSAFAEQKRECLPPAYDMIDSIRSTYVYVNYKNQHKRCYSLDSLSIRGNVDVALRNVAERRNSLLANLQADFDSTARSEISGVTVKSTSLNLPGELSFELRGVPSSGGDVDIIVGGPQLLASLSVKKSWYITGSASVRTNAISLRGKYNLLTGLVDRVTISDLNASVNVDFDSPLEYLLPGITHVLINYFENKFEDIAEQQIKSIVDSSASSYSKTLFGLEEEIPMGQFLFQGLDIGLIVKTELARASGSLSIKVSQSGTNLNDTTITFSIPRENITLIFGSKWVEALNERCEQRCV